MKYSVLYVESSSSKLKLFDSYEAAVQFVGAFTLQNLENTDDNWVDAVFKGEPIVTAPSLQVSRE